MYLCIIMTQKYINNVNNLTSKYINNNTTKPLLEYGCNGGNGGNGSNGSNGNEKKHIDGIGLTKFNGIVSLFSNPSLSNNKREDLIGTYDKNDNKNDDITNDMTNDTFKNKSFKTKINLWNDKIEKNNRITVLSLEDIKKKNADLNQKNPISMTEIGTNSLLGEHSYCQTNIISEVKIESITKKHNKSKTKKHKDSKTKKHKESTTKKHKESTTKKHTDSKTKKNKESTTKKNKESTTKKNKESTTKKHDSDDDFDPFLISR